jgi:2-amino-4-hydroxy-6-hydroxymethyldihydropteridine diphosphokinase
MNNIAIIGIGSNINAFQNIEKALIEITDLGKIIKKTKFIETEPLLFIEQENFLNGAVLLETEFDFENLNSKLKNIEIKLGRIKTVNKNGPRIIDLDILVFNNKITDKDVFEREFLKQFVIELIPELNCC